MHRDYNWGFLDCWTSDTPYLMSIPSSRRPSSAYSTTNKALQWITWLYVSCSIHEVLILLSIKTQMHHLPDQWRYKLKNMTCGGHGMASCMHAVITLIQRCQVTSINYHQVYEVWQCMELRKVGLMDDRVHQLAKASCIPVRKHLKLHVCVISKYQDLKLGMGEQLLKK